MASTFRRPKKAGILNQTSTKINERSDALTGISMDSLSVSKLQMKGTKIWTNGCTLVSTGLRELDSLMLSSSGSVGGQPLGTCIFLESSDRLWSVLTNCIVRYWCAEAISQEQSLIIPVAAANGISLKESDALCIQSSWTETDRPMSPQEFKTSMVEPEVIHNLLDSLPSNMNFQQELQKSEANTSSSSKTTLLQPLSEEYEDEHNDDEQNAEEGLVVAWQYRKEIQQERLGLPAANKFARRNVSGRPAAVYCYSYNLQGRLKDQMDPYSHVSLIPIDAASKDAPFQHGMSFYQKLITAAVAGTRTSSQSNEGGSCVARILLYHPDMAQCSFALPLFLHYIRKHNLPVVVLVVPGARSDRTALVSVRRCSDVVMSTESFAMRSRYPPPAEFRHLHGILHISRLSTITQSSISGHFADRTTERSPAAVRYGLHRDRRKLNISLLHIPPEDYAADGGSVSSYAVRTAAGRPNATSTTSGAGCGQTGPSLLDF